MNSTRWLGMRGKLSVLLTWSFALAAASSRSASAENKPPASLPPPPAQGRMTEQDCKDAASHRPNQDETTLGMVDNATAATSRATCEMQRTFDATRKSLQTKPRALALLDQTQLAWLDYAAAQETEQFPEQDDARGAYGSIYPVCSLGLHQASAKLRGKELPTSVSCKTNSAASAKTAAALSEAQGEQRVLLARIKEVYRGQVRLLSALKAGQAAYEKRESVQAALAAELGGGPDGDCARRERLRLTSERTAYLREWLSASAQDDACSGSRGGGLPFNVAEQRVLAKDGTKRALAARDQVKKLRPEVERLTKALQAAETKLEALGKSKNEGADKAQRSFAAYRSARATAATFPKKELSASTSDYRAALAQNIAYSKQLTLVRKAQADLAKVLPLFEAARTEATKATAAVENAAKLLTGWKGAPNSEAATKALAAVEQENAKLVALGAPANAAALTRASQANEARWAKAYLERFSEVSDGLGRASYEQKLSEDPKAKKQCDLQKVDWKNLSYPPNWLTNDFKLKNGHAEQISEDPMGEQHGQIIELGPVQLGDLDRDGKPEAYVVVIAGGIGHASVSRTFAYVFDTDASCTLRYLSRAESCSDDVKLVGKALRVDNCEEDAQDEYTLSAGELKKSRSIKR